MDVYERANIRPTRKEQSTQNQTKMCAIIVFDVCFELYAEPLFGNVGLNGSLNNVATKNDISTLNPSGAIRLYSEKAIGAEGAGWYRFAKITCEADTIAKGSTYMLIETLIRQTFSNALGCFHKIDFYLIYNDNARISVTGHNSNVLKKVRIVRNGNTIFLDVYSSAIINATEMLSFIPFNSGIQSAENVKIHLVPETADGEVIVRSVELVDNI